MAHEYEQEIKCPYCDTEFGDSWEYNHDDGATTNCVSCSKEFNLSVSIDVTYSTYKKDCKDGKHDYGEPDDYRLKSGVRVVECKNCDSSNYINDDGKLRF